MIHSIILARGGSKGIKGKNLKHVGGKPLLFWSINASLKSKKIFKTWVSSDSKKILDYSLDCGANIIKRPKKISTDIASSETAWVHAIKFIEKNFQIETVVGIQPTSPIKSGKDFDDAIKDFSKKKYDSLFSSCLIKDYCVWEKNKSFKALYDYKKRKRRQEFKEKYLENGSFYIFNKKKFLMKNNRLFGNIGTFKQNKLKSFQIDDFEDLFIVDTLLMSNKNKKFLR
tara:strand:+ start:1455 stop:2138 length:684 start_codon:yes stop_codon:yes gene_type:complete